VVKLIAPISPFFSDAIFRNLNNTSKKEKADAVHLTRFPLANDHAIDTALEERMQLAQDVSSLVLSLRKKLNIKVRQPLQKVLIPVLNPAMQAQLQKVEDLIKAEVNVKEIAYLTETEGIINKKVKPNFKALGARLGANMKVVATLISKMSQHDIAALEQNGQFPFDVNGEIITITLPEVEITAEDIPGWSVAAKGNITVALDITITDDLRNEGDAREFINRIQNLRKDKDFELTDRLSVYIVENEKLRKSLNQFKSYICAEILADSIDWVPEIHDGISIDINDTPLKINVIKKS
jgi:isoleucyl-tRNA synthetase